MKTVSSTLMRRQKSCSALTTRTSISSVEKETKANRKKASKRNIIVVDSNDQLARNRDRTPKSTKRKNFWCFKVTVDLQECLPKNHSHARLLCYNHRKLYIIVKLVKFRIRRINWFWIWFNSERVQASNAKLTLFAKLNYLPSCSHELPNKVHNVNQ